MTIASLDDLVAGFQQPRFMFKRAFTPAIGRPHSTWFADGVPSIGPAFAAAPNGAVFSQSGGLVQGAIPFFDPTGGPTNQYLARFLAYNYTNVGGRVLLCDRIWDRALTINSTSAQTVTSCPTWPARDATGTTNGEGVLLAVEVSGTAGAQSAAATASYTNSGGTSGRTTTGFTTGLATASAGITSFFPLGLQAGDLGVQSVASLTFSTAWTTGTIGLVAYRILAATDFGYGIGAEITPQNGGLPQLWNGTTPFIVFIPIAATSFQANAMMTTVWN